MIRPVVSCSCSLSSRLIGSVVSSCMTICVGSSNEILIYRLLFVS
jgi:hypothetical protein